MIPCGSNIKLHYQKPWSPFKSYWKYKYPFLWNKSFSFFHLIKVPQNTNKRLRKSHLKCMSRYNSNHSLSSHKQWIKSVSKFRQYIWNALKFIFQWPGDKILICLFICLFVGSIYMQPFSRYSGRLTMH